MPAGLEPRSFPRGRREEGEGKEGGGRGRDCGPEEASHGAARSPGGAGGQRRGRPGPMPLALPSRRSSLSRAVSICAPPCSLRARSLARSLPLSRLSVSLALCLAPLGLFPSPAASFGPSLASFLACLGSLPLSASRSLRGAGGSPKIAALTAAPKPLQAPVPGRWRGGGGPGREERRGGSLSHFPAPVRARPSAHSRPLSLLAPQPRPMEPSRPAPGRLRPLLCLLLAASSAWSGKHPHPPPLPSPDCGFRPLRPPLG